MSDIENAIDRLGFDQITVNTSLFTQDDDLSYHINGVHDLVERIEEVVGVTQNSYFTEDDRSKVKEIRTEASAFSKKLSQAVIEHKKTLVTEMDEEKKAVVNKLAELTDTLATELDRFDQRIRAEKRADMEMSFDDTVGILTNNKSGSDILADLNLNQIENPSWYNRSASTNKSVNEMTERVNTILVLNDTYNQDGEHSADDLISLLSDNEWSTAAVMVVLHERKREAEEAEAEAQRVAEKRAKEIAEAEERGRIRAQEQAERERQQAIVDEHEREDRFAKAQWERSVNRLRAERERSEDKAHSVESTFNMAVQYTKSGDDTHVRDRVEAAVHKELDALVDEGVVSSANVSVND